MRISTNTIFDKGVARMGELQTDLAKTQQQVSTGRRITSPSDDPVASARALEVSQAKEVNAKFAINRRNSRDSLVASEGALQNVTSLLQDVKTLVVAAGNGVLEDTQRKYIATELKGRFDELLGLANSRDGVGAYIFAGYQSATQPFSASSTGATYAGDQGQRLMQVASGRQIEIAENGYEAFEKISSKGVFTGFSVGTGTGTISSAVVDDARLVTGHSYDIEMTVGGTTTYEIFDITNDPTKTTPIATGTYSSGGQISVDGLKFSISGAPANGDIFTIRPNGNQSVFTTLKNLITALEAPTSSAIDKAKLGYELGLANTNVDNALDHVLTTRAAIGSSLKEIESLDNMGDDLNIQYESALSDLQDLDYVQAITNLTKQQTVLQAAQQSFVKVSGLTLFNFLQ
ncbi:MAG TPA: flagellar hook-associated protein FlgL [Noviherbaspirillum sp.]|nr:flagellar hook-associated protein FlgL [Noviherbaspirillum sp.]